MLARDSRLPRWALLLAGIAASALAFAAGDLQPIPPLTARVTDTTGTLDFKQKQTLESELAALEQRKGSQVAVLIVPTTQPEEIEQYSIRVFDAWKLGRKNIDDGVLVLVAKNDHRVRIEPARGLEGAIPDAACSRIIREYIAPKFRAGDYFGGIEDAVGALTKLIDGEPLPPPLTKDRQRGNDDVGGTFSIFTTIVFVAFWLRVMFGRLPALPRAGIAGAVCGGVALFFGAAAVIALGAALLGALIGVLSGGGGGFANRGGFGGFGGGSFGGGLGGGSWGGGGGFSGGGGISSGGGASGSW